jgi:hypothetical protein
VALASGFPFNVSVNRNLRVARSGAAIRSRYAIEKRMEGGASIDPVGKDNLIARHCPCADTARHADPQTEICVACHKDGDRAEVAQAVIDRSLEPPAIEPAAVGVDRVSDRAAIIVKAETVAAGHGERSR